MKNRGFTLIELLVTLMIATIVAVMAVPTFASFLARQQLASDVNELISVLSFARSEAIKQRSDMSVVFSPPDAASSNRRPESCRNNEIEDDSGENSEESIRYRYTGGCYWVVKSGAGSQILRVGQSANIASPTQAFSLTFQSLGDADISNCPESPCEMTLKTTEESASTPPVTLVIRNTGSIRRKESES
ncbi:GspH/FimT family pseudopilin [Halomonas sp. QHL1]|uniref:GspH/FimT family pseudopilin n=1 Tax=Halomonas sp. QHL1 TaxID=1123773 RepID=UPI0008FCE75E|nr:GspH/FimT family pseudopilin [Halomonas sp. QHL1]OJA05618.1 prepilin-type N-terminal cleavage/methylation domain-containing protein [Halomonas sp. QHL1]